MIFLLESIQQHNTILWPSCDVVKLIFKKHYYHHQVPFAEKRLLTVVIVHVLCIKRVDGKQEIIVTETDEPLP